MNEYKFKAMNFKSEIKIISVTADNLENAENEARIKCYQLGLCLLYIT